MSPLVSVDNWGDYSKSPPPDNAETLLLAASGSIRSYCGWNITREVVEDAELDAYGGPLLALPTLHLVSIEALYEEDSYLEDRVDYRWSRRGLIRRKPKGKCWPSEYGCIRYSITHGYETCPAELAALTIGLAKRADTVPTGILQKQVGGISLQFKDVPLDSAEKGVLDAYALESGRTN